MFKIGFFPFVLIPRDAIDTLIAHNEDFEM